MVNGATRPMSLSYDHFQLLLLLLIANGAPILGALVFRSSFNHPLDNGLVFGDGRPLFGESKSWRGIVVALLLTPLASSLLGSGWLLGIVVAVFAMLGDLFSSFIKRRISMPSSSMALGLDQIPEALFPLLACHLLVDMTMQQTGLLVLLFFVLELVLSRILYWLHIRSQPF